MTAAMFAPQPAHRIMAVDEAQRTVTLEQLDVVPFPMITNEGHMLLVVPGPPGQPPAAAVPIEVTALEPGRRIVATFRGGAARHLATKTDVFLVRPFAGAIDMTDPATLEPAPTRAFRGLPEAILPAGAAADSPPPQGGDPITAARNAARRVQASNNLKQIMLALHNFHDTYGCFPPAAVIGPDGRPWHSWRVLLLPFFEEVNLYKEYDFSQPWDAPANLEAAKKQVPVYADPMTDAKADTVISYALLVGEQAMFQPGLATMQDANAQPLASDALRQQRLAQVTDGTSNTICVAPFLRDRDTPWTKPDDIVVTADFPGIGKPGGIAAPYPLPDGSGVATLVGFADGSVRTLPVDLDADTLAALITRGGGEVIDFESLGGGASEPARPTVPFLRIVRDGSRGVKLEMR